MNKEQKSRSQRDSTPLQREIWRQDIANQLVNYGIYPESEPIPVEKLKHLDDHGIAIRLDLDIAISKEKKASLSFSEADRKLCERGFFYLS